MIVWEYLRVSNGDSYDIPYLDALGALEWELVCFDMHGGAYFKRLKRKDALNALTGEPTIPING